MVTMHAVALTILSFILLLCHVEANPRLKHTPQHKAISRNLQQLMRSYKRCHINIILYNEEVELHRTRSPYALFRTPENQSRLKPIKIGGYAFPQMRHMIDHCEATMQVLPSQRQFIKQLHVDSTRGPQLRPDEGKVAGYTLKRRYSFLLVNFTAQFRDITASIEAGGNLFVVLKYRQRRNMTASTHYTVKSATVICEYCLRREQSLKCANVTQCLHLVVKAQEEMTRGGRGERLWPHRLPACLRLKTF